MEVSYADVKPSFPPSSSSNNGAEDDNIQNFDKPPTKFDPDDLFYDMSGHKYLIIFNHTIFKNTRYFNFQRPSPRKGTEEDVKALKKTFSDLGYKILTYHDLDHGEILNKALEISRMDHSRTSCLCVAILTHGDKDGDLFASDRAYKFSDITKMLENGDKSLVNKPKLFFIQACRGENVDAGRRVEIDGDESNILHVPSHADFFVLYSTVEGYLSYRNVLGSFMIQELCKAVDEFHDKLDVLHIATLVNRRVAYNYSTYTPRDITKDNKKQMPEARFTLTKLFKF